MRISDVKVTVWEWKDIPPTRYTLRVKSSGTKSVEMGLVRIITDEGIEGHAFLGSALSGLGGDAKTIVDRFKPMLVGQDPLAREKIWLFVWCQILYKMLNTNYKIDQIGMGVGKIYFLYVTPHSYQP